MFEPGPRNHVNHMKDVGPLAVAVVGATVVQFF